MTFQHDADANPPDDFTYLYSPRGARVFAGKRGVAASTASTVVIVALIVGLLWVAPGGATVRHTFFDPHDIWLSWTGNPRLGIDSIRDGLVTNIWMFLVSEVLVLIFGLLIAWVRISQTPVLFPFRILATAYTDLSLIHI